MQGRHGLLAAIIALSALMPATAMADHRHHHGGARYNFSFNYGSPYYHGGYYRPYAHHRHYAPRFGPTFYYYEVPVVREYEVTRIVEPTPQISGPPPTQNWYLCEDSGEYYPYVTECDSDWKVVPATPRK